MERWKDAVGFEGALRVSNTGRVWNVHKNRETVPYDNGCGYKKVNIRINGKDMKVYVHRLVALTFIPNADGRKEVNHIDSNPANNHVSNLEWVSSSENTVHAVKKGRLVPWGNSPRAIIASRDGKSIRFETISQAERYFDTRHINQVLSGKRKHAKGWSFVYAEGGDADVHDNHRKTKRETEIVFA